ncbi:MAG TPA: hypothetical protein DDZ81_15195 [Acetobacteraceae bacterium]|nr:hypothetical protein [Acetobacteraceae bacterium]
MGLGAGGALVATSGLVAGRGAGGSAGATATGAGGASTTAGGGAAAVRSALLSGTSGAGASLAFWVSDPPENTSFSAPSIFMPPGFAGFSRIGRASALTTGISPL